MSSGTMAGVIMMAVLAIAAVAAVAVSAVTAARRRRPQRRSGLDPTATEDPADTMQGPVRRGSR